jgi:hypothetical protein
MYNRIFRRTFVFQVLSFSEKQRNIFRKKLRGLFPQNLFYYFPFSKVFRLLFSQFFAQKCLQGSPIFQKDLGEPNNSNSLYNTIQPFVVLQIYLGKTPENRYPTHFSISHSFLDKSIYGFSLHNVVYNTIHLDNGGTNCTIPKLDILYQLVI